MRVFALQAALLAVSAQDPKCKEGILASDKFWRSSGVACCLEICESCSNGKQCKSQGKKAEECCPWMIAKNDVSCDVQAAPCMLQPHQPKVDSLTPTVSPGANGGGGNVVDQATLVDPTWAVPVIEQTPTPQPSPYISRNQQRMQKEHVIIGDGSGHPMSINGGDDDATEFKHIKKLADRQSIMKNQDDERAATLVDAGVGSMYYGQSASLPSPLAPPPNFDDDDGNMNPPIPNPTPKPVPTRAPTLVPTIHPTFTLDQKLKNLLRQLRTGVPSASPTDAPTPMVHHWTLKESELLKFYKKHDPDKAELSFVKTIMQLYQPKDILAGLWTTYHDTIPGAPSPSPTNSPSTVPSAKPTAEPSPSPSPSPTPSPTNRLSTKDKSIMAIFSPKTQETFAVMDRAQRSIFYKMTEKERAAFFNMDPISQKDYLSIKNASIVRASFSTQNRNSIPTVGPTIRATLQPHKLSGAKSHNQPTLLQGPYGDEPPSCCNRCPKGRFNHVAVASGSCPQCPRGHYSESGSTCKICPIGFFSAVRVDTKVKFYDGAYVCYYCPTGKFALYFGPGCSSQKGQTPSPTVPTASPSRSPTAYTWLDMLSSPVGPPTPKPVPTFFPTPSPTSSPTHPPTSKPSVVPTKYKIPEHLLERFYAEHDPSKIPLAGEMMREYSPQEILDGLWAQYHLTLQGAPSNSPTFIPTTAPTVKATKAPTAAPTSVSPTRHPTEAPRIPTKHATLFPTATPTQWKITSEALATFYQAYNPKQAASVKEILQLYSQKEILTGIWKKYHATIPGSSAVFRPPVKSTTTSKNGGKKTATHSLSHSPAILPTVRSPTESPTPRTAHTQLAVVTHHRIKIIQPMEKKKAANITPAQLKGFYQKHDATKIPMVDEILKAYSSTELLDGLEKKYHDARQYFMPTPPPTPKPIFVPLSSKSPTSIPTAPPTVSPSGAPTTTPSTTNAPSFAPSVPPSPRECPIGTGLGLGTSNGPGIQSSTACQKCGAGHYGALRTVANKHSSGACYSCPRGKHQPTPGQRFCFSSNSHPCSELDIRFFCLSKTYVAAMFNSSKYFKDSQGHCYNSLTRNSKHCQIKSGALTQAFQTEPHQSEFVATKRKMEKRCWFCVKDTCEHCLPDGAFIPSTSPTTAPTPSPTHSPTAPPPTLEVTVAPSVIPTPKPTVAPTSRPTRSPTTNPSRKVTVAPTFQPTKWKITGVQLTAFYDVYDPKHLTLVPDIIKNYHTGEIVAGLQRKYHAYIPGMPKHYKPPTPKGTLGPTSGSFAPTSTNTPKPTSIPTHPPVSRKCGEIFKRCGGEGWYGATCCAGQCKCVWVTKLFSRCQPPKGAWSCGSRSSTAVLSRPTPSLTPAPTTFTPTVAPTAMPSTTNAPTTILPTLSPTLLPTAPISPRFEALLPPTPAPLGVDAEYALEEKERLKEKEDAKKQPLSVPGWMNGQMIVDASKTFMRGASPWLAPSASSWSNSRNIQPNADACKAQCMALKKCNFGTYIAGGDRAGECWLAAINSATPIPCGVPCTSFQKREKSLERQQKEQDSELGHKLTRKGTRGPEKKQLIYEEGLVDKAAYAEMGAAKTALKHDTQIKSMISKERKVVGEESKWAGADVHGSIEDSLILQQKSIVRKIRQSEQAVISKEEHAKKDAMKVVVQKETALTTRASSKRAQKKHEVKSFLTWLVNRSGYDKKIMKLMKQVQTIQDGMLQANTDEST